MRAIPPSPGSRNREPAGAELTQGFSFTSVLRFDATGRYLLGMRVYVQNRAVQPTDRGEVDSLVARISALEQTAKGTDERLGKTISASAAGRSEIDALAQRIAALEQATKSVAERLGSKL